MRDTLRDIDLERARDRKSNADRDVYRERESLINVYRSMYIHLESVRLGREEKHMDIRETERRQKKETERERERLRERERRREEKKENILSEEAFGLPIFANRLSAMGRLLNDPMLAPRIN